MSRDNKVVRLNKQQGTDRFVMPQPLVRLRDVSGRGMKQLLGDFFDGADDALFNMADRAGSNQEQTAYFDAMRELRLRRKSMTLAVLQWMSRAFNEIGRFDPTPGSHALEDIDQSSLSLLGHDDLEQKVAIDNLISKLRNHHGEAIQLLDARVSHLMPGIKLEARQMPLSPEVICKGLGEACSDLEIDIRAKLVVLKLFDKLLISRLDAFYQEANRLLVSESVLPDLKRPPVSGSAQRPPVRSPVPGRTAGSGAGAQPDDSQAGSSATFSELSALLHQDNRLVPVVGSAAGASGQELDTASLMQRLNELQSSENTQGAAFSGQVQGSGSAPVVPLADWVRQVLQATNGQRYAVQQVDSDVINLVSMLFDFILEDRQLPPLMKAIIGRLQIPVLKVALTDRSFFNRGGHPARKLLNELAMAGIGWNPKAEGHRDPLRDKIETVVDRLLNEFTNNVELFSELLDDFCHFMDLDRRRRELVEQRLRDAEEGRARQEHAREAAETLLSSAMEGHQIPEAVVSLLQEPWRKYLEWTLLRKGEQSSEWQKAGDLTHQLVWSLDPAPVDEYTRASLLRAIPGIVDNLRSGLHTISWDPFATDSLIRDLELAHVDVLQGLASYRKAQPEPEEPVRDEQPGASVAESPDDEPVARVDTTRPTEAPVSGTVDTEGTQGTATAASGRDAAADDTTDSAVAVEPRWLEAADRMGVGSWVEWQSGGQKVRCKLAAIIKATGKYIFVNRNGAKVAEYRREGLAEAISTGQVAMLDDGLIFDRALESIIDNLRHSRKD